MAKILEVEHLKKYYKVPTGYLHAVDDVSFSIEEGQTLGVVGESGCGKSTLGNTLMQLESPTGGKITFCGKGYTHPGRHGIKELRQKMQFIFQDPYSSLDPRMTVQQLIMEPLLIHKVPRAEAAKRTAELMERVGLAPRTANSYPHELDGGRRQRIGIARALALRPQFIICDEPVSALDVSIQAQVLNLMQDLQDHLGLTYLFITHDLSVVKHISDYIMVMYLGKTVEYAPVEEMFERPLHPYSQALLSAIPQIDIDRPKQQILLEGEIVSPINPAPGCRFAARCRYATDICRSQDPQLQDIGNGHMVACHLCHENSDPKKEEEQ